MCVLCVNVSQNGQTTTPGVIGYEQYNSEKAKVYRAAKFSYNIHVYMDNTFFTMLVGRAMVVNFLLLLYDRAHARQDIIYCRNL